MTSEYTDLVRQLRNADWLHRQAADAIECLTAELTAANAAIKTAQDEAAWCLRQRDKDGERIAALERENARLIQANEAWHLRVESLKCQVESEGERGETAEAERACLIIDYQKAYARAEKAEARVAALESALRESCDERRTYLLHELGCPCPVEARVTVLWRVVAAADAMLENMHEWPAGLYAYNTARAKLKEGE